MTGVWAAGRITVDEGETIVDGEYRTDQRWNGWLCPRMKADACEQVLRAIAEFQPENYLIMLDGDRYVIWDDNYADAFHPVTGECDAVEIHAPDDDGWYYPGYMGWCWELVRPHSRWYRRDIADWWCNDCQTVADYCQQTNPT